ncbi:MAG: succinate dehydrogenase, cytochrome b556 subunit [Gammaproteobacteria bacterium]|nr:succinate dehydrogenase, cytochrome b556 subunit [Gammaproteobacteria bacterium]
MLKERPLSPHLQVYRPQMTSMLSILHRATGVFLFLGSPLLVYSLWGIAEGGTHFQQMTDCLSHWFAQLLILGWIYSLFYHFCNGIRHLFWDVGHGYEMKTLYASGNAVLLISIALTAITAYFALQNLGGAA